MVMLEVLCRVPVVTESFWNCLKGDSADIADVVPNGSSKVWQDGI
jgi:hypothetical protein